VAGFSNIFSSDDLLMSEKIMLDEKSSQKDYVGLASFMESLRSSCIEEVKESPPEEPIDVPDILNDEVDTRGKIKKDNLSAEAAEPSAALENNSID
jgi:hypothetical protein